ncbi:MAG: aminopeptidase [Ignavibacteriales bacterium]|nr:aminopeptidase [Ignavibacteriales bacterium]
MNTRHASCPGDRVLIEATTAAEPLVRELYIQILEKGGHPHPMIGFPGMVPFVQDDLYVTYAKDTQLDFVPTFYKVAYDQFESRIRIHSATNTLRPPAWTRSSHSGAARQSVRSPPPKCGAARKACSSG